MGYAYEDDDLIQTDDLEEELDENLNVKKKKVSKEEVTKNNAIDNKKLSLDQLLASDANSSNYSIDNLLEEEKEADGVVLDELLTKKDDKLFKLYLGNSYSKITSKQFNYAALFLGPIYLLYRKVYMVGFVWLFLDLFTLFLLPLAKVHYVIIIIFEVLSFICSGVFANQIVLNHVGSKILNYKMMEYSKEKLQDTIKKNGGTNLILAIIIFVIVASSLVMFFWGQIKRILATQVSNNNTNMLNVEKVSFDGKINVDKNVNIRDTLSISVPNDFYLANEEKYQYYYVYQDPDAYIPLCSIELDKVIGYKTPELFISAIASYHLELEDNIETLESNNHIWKYINVTDSTKNIYYATTSINDEMYLLKFTYQYVLTDECGSHFEEIINSINNT